MTKLSIVVPVYNVEKYIFKCYESIKSQDFSDYEVIFVDDESPDNCPAILDGWALEDSRISVIHKKNEGVSEARNDGLNAANGDYIFFMDSDDWLPEGALSSISDLAILHNADIVIADHYVSKGDNDLYVRMFSNEFVTSDRSEIETIQCSVMNMGPTCYKTDRFEVKAGSAAPWHHLFRTNFLRTNNLKFDADLKGLFDDGLFTLNALEGANTVAYFAKPIYHYRIVDSSLTQGYNPALINKAEGVFGALRKFIENSNNKKLPEAFDQRVYAYLNKAASDIYLNPKNPQSKADRYKGFCELAKSEPYVGALKRMNTKHLGKKRSRFLATMLKLSFFRAYWLLKQIG